MQNNKDCRVIGLVFKGEEELIVYNEIKKIKEKYGYPLQVIVKSILKNYFKGAEVKFDEKKI